MKVLVCIFVTGVLVAAIGCSTDEDEPQLPAYCNPLSVDHCLLPWPSSFYLKQDSSTKTGYRVDYRAEALPKNQPTDDGTGDKHVDPARYNLLDGFSVASHPVVYFKSGVSKEGLPTPDNLADSVTDKSPVWIMEYDTGEKVPLFAEIDANARAKTSTVGALIIRPQVRLKFDTRYVVVLRSSLKDDQGQPLRPPEPFRRIRDNEEIQNETLRSEKARIEEVLAFLDAQKVARSDLVLAWDFRTSSQEAIEGNLLGMVDEALSNLPSDGPGFSDLVVIDYEDEQAEPYIMRRIEGQFHVPSFLESDEPTSWLKVDAQGKPVYRGTQKFPFFVQIPRCAAQATGPLPVFIFGHGIFRSPKPEMAQEYHRKLMQRLCMVEVGAYWHGMCELDIVNIVETAVLDWTNFPQITDRLQQAHVNFQVLTRLMQGPFVQDSSMRLTGGKQVTDGKQPIYYMGISMGGIGGVTFAALSKDIERAVFHVSGGWWSLMMQRSSNWQAFDIMLDRIYPEPLDQLLLIQLSQQLWDYTDPIIWAPHVIASPLPGRSPKKVILQESLDDDQVPNLATRVVGRALGLENLSPVIEEVFQIPSKTGPLDRAYMQWNFDPPSKPPGTNQPAHKPQPEESAHDRIRRMESFAQQLEDFFKPDGKVVHPCQGPCDPE